MPRNASPDPIQAVALPEEVINVADQIFDLVVSHELNEVGNYSETRDETTSSFFRIGALPVFDNNGNMVISGGS